MHLFHDYIISMTYDEVISTCRICGKEKRKPWYPIIGWARPPKTPPKKLYESASEKKMTADG